jgi:hypothetical protein
MVPAGPSIISTDNSKFRYDLCLYLTHWGQDEKVSTISNRSGHEITVKQQSYFL